MFDKTQTQGSEEHRQARQLSLERTRPPVDVPGYEPQQFLGAGAYGEVWVALDRNTGRRVAIKFYTHRGGLDWSLLSREVEKLVFLSADRYVVQLLDVGWDAEPPYYVMEYLEHGSLDDLLKRDGTLSVGEAVALFREVAIGLVHAHGRGVLHCDLKPGNVLLDQDNKPRLADFGQSRLSHEQDPALGTLFYMAPEQADLKSVPDARWDVYALGALLYAMLTGAPPYRNEAALAEMERSTDLEDRLARYRRWLTTSPRPTAHRQLSNVDSGLADIIDRCLAIRPERRFPNPQAVLDALDAREVRRAKRPLVVLGLVGPLLLAVVMGVAAVNALRTAVSGSDVALTERALESNRFAAMSQARDVASQLERRVHAVERLARDPFFQALVEETAEHPELLKLQEQLDDPSLDEQTLKPLRDEYRNHPARRPLQLYIEQLRHDPLQPKVASWFVDAPSGLQMVRWPVNPTIARNYGWRNYFQRGRDDQPGNWRPEPGDVIKETKLSAVFLSEASGRWIAAVSTPIYKGGPDGKLLGVLALTDEIGSFVRLEGESETSESAAAPREEQLAVLVDWRDGPNKGLVLQHPLFDRLRSVPEKFKDLRVLPEELPSDLAKKADYRDPMAAAESGEAYSGRWLADVAPVVLNGKSSGLLVIVQESYDHAIGQSIDQLSGSLRWIVGVAAAAMCIVITSLWFFVIRGLAHLQRLRNSETSLAGSRTQSPSTVQEAVRPRPDDPGSHG